MTITIGFGWWIAPAVITIIALGWAAFMSRDMGNDRFGAGAVIAGFLYLIAAVVSLVAWLIWALVA